MPHRHPPIIRDYPHFLHGGDYNPDQWLHAPEVIDEDFRLMDLAGCNAMSVGIFAWTALEPEEGRFTFDWLDRIMDRLAETGRKAVLATPSGARPAWMAQKYPEVRRVTREGLREPFHRRHNHCPTSPVYRDKVALINDQLARRYAEHPALGVWHLSNEYGGECCCELCVAAFQRWLQERYGSLDALNQAWWAAFWSHTFTDWSQIGATDPTLDGQALDWKRFVSDQTVDFVRHEIAALRPHTPEVPITTNLMGGQNTIDYWALAEHLDVISHDFYFGERRTYDPGAAQAAFTHDLFRSLKRGRPFMLMESSPSSQNWNRVPRLKRPGQHRLESLQAVAHGSDTVQYFQWRKGRGGGEKFHGAVVDHVGHEHTRVFDDVADVGRVLPKLAPVLGTSVAARVAVVYDWPCRWALELSGGPGHEQKDYPTTCRRHHAAFWRLGVAVDLISADSDLSDYDLVVAPMMYMVRGEMGARIARFVEAGGTFVATYLTGIVNETNLCFTTGWPGGGLRELLGVWAEELDVLHDDEVQHLAFGSGNTLGLTGGFDVGPYCDLLHAEDCTVVARYARDFYADRPAITCRQVGEGEAWYLGARAGDDLLDAFYSELARRLDLPRALPADLPPGVRVHERADGEHRFIFVMNFSDRPQTVELGDLRCRDMISDEALAGQASLSPFGVRVLQPVGR